MPFIGNQPALSYTSFAKQDFTTSATTSYTLDNPVANENEIALFINFVRQEPTTAYTASGTTLTLTSATSASDDMYCVFLGKAVQTVNPPNSSVGASQIVDASITSAKLASGVLPTNTPAFHVKLSSTQDTTDLITTKIQFDEELFDTDNCYDNVTNYRFTPNVAGKYFVYVSFINRSSVTNELTNARTYIYKNGAEVHGAYATDFRNNTGFVALSYMGALVDMNGTTDYIEYYSRVDHSGGSNAGVQDRSYAGAYKIIE